MPMHNFVLAYTRTANMIQNRPKEVEDLLSTTSARRNYTLKLGICSKCNKDFYTFGFGFFCSNKCAQFIHGENGSGYLRTTINGVRGYVHRFVSNAPKGKVVHHINGIKTDNRLENLEFITQSEHCREHQKEMKLAQYG